MFNAKIKPKSKLTYLTCQELINQKNEKELRLMVSGPAKPSPPAEKCSAEDAPRAERS